MKSSRSSTSSPDPDQICARQRPRTMLPSLPWVEFLGFLVMIALAVSGQL